MSKQRPSAERQAEITRIAAALFNDRGFHTTSMEDVAEAVGVKKPTLYHYVQSKAQIVAWIHDECVEAVLPPLLRYVEEGLPAGEVLRRVACDIFGLLEAKPGYLRIYFENHRDLDSASRQRIAGSRDEYYELVKQVLERGAAAGELSVEDPSLSALAFFGMCDWGYQWFQPGGARSVDEVAGQVWRIFMAGVAAPGADRLTSTG